MTNLAHASEPQTTHDISDFSRERKRFDVLSGTVRRLVARDVREDSISPPLLPAVAFDLNRVTAKPAFEMSEVIEVIQHDQFIAAKLLQVSNSGFFGRGVEVKSLQGAISRLGIDRVRELVFAISLKWSILKDSRDKARMTTLFEHALTTAVVARKIGERRPDAFDTDQAFLAGLLHDIGKPTLALTLTRIESELRDKCEVDLDIANFMEEIFDSFHVEVGGLVARRWSLPAGIHDAILYHHDDDLAPEADNCIAAVQLADRIAKAVASDDEDRHLVAIESCGLLERLRISSKDLEEFIGDGRKALQEAAKAFA